MSAQINRGHRKHRHSSGIKENRSWLQYNSVYHACNEYLKRCHLDTTDEYTNNEKEEENEQLENQLA